MIILGVTLAIIAMIVVGLLVARRVAGDSRNFLVAGRTLALPVVAATLMGQAVDTNATLGATDLAATLGFWAGAGLPVGLALCLLLTGLFFARPMNRMGLTTLPDYFRLRYSRAVEVAAALLMIAAFAILVAGNLVAGGFLFERFLGTSYTGGILIIVAVVLIYTLAGGLLSDAYTSIVQMLITAAAAFALLFWVALTYGLSAAPGTGPLDLEQLSDPAQGAVVNWATLVALGVGDIVAIDFMQRIFAARSPDVARRACFIAAAGTTVIGVPFALAAVSTGQGLLTLLDEAAPAGLSVLVLAGIVSASLSTADGAILGTAAVAVRNVGSARRVHHPGRPDPLLRATRWAMPPVVGGAVLLALRVPQTGVLLTLAFDLMLACLVVPFVLGFWWRRGGAPAAMAALTVGLVVRLALFVITPTMYGAPNTLLYLPNTLVDATFDGWPTFIALGASLIAYLSVALLTAPAGVAGRELRVEESAPVRDG
ncbi:sodium:solute symporter family protein [Nonomuraea gerenzanensis]|uniref:Sodium-solute symporter, putative n=1 Tax=Nonomuraea gerenzanensis TaxID=93944 RepID=A0A1M4EER7_9ACTN|nr:sodium:solute symporter family protein [Nonomuraea gerenzanensis]UBU08906.1 sodium:solute symporter family protein [Nonomuraea gerenzanensis]SBO97282.1 sodium-solute symporter, putative [Nonomuraea gerenzanensis]